MFVVRPALRTVFVLVIFAVETFAELATAAAVLHRPVPVLAKGFGDIVLVGVEIDDDDRLAEGRSQKGQQEEECSAVTEHSSLKFGQR